MPFKGTAKASSPPILLFCPHEFYPLEVLNSLVTLSRSFVYALADVERCPRRARNTAEYWEYCSTLRRDQNPTAYCWRDGISHG